MKDSNRSLSLVQSRFLKKRPKVAVGHRVTARIARTIAKTLQSVRSARAVQELRDRVFLRAEASRKESGKGSLVAFTGLKGKEGATTVSLLVSLGLTEMNRSRILYFDGRFDGRRFAAYKDIFELRRSSVECGNGFSFLECYASKGSNLCFINSPNVNSLDFFTNEEIPTLLSELKESFDYVIFDMPPMLVSSETKVFCPRADQLYLVFSPGKTLLRDIDKCQATVAKAGGEIHGVVLNRQKIPWWSRFFATDSFV